MTIEKVLNNNVVIVVKDGKEMVVMGKGLAFKKSKGDSFDESKVDKVFTLKSEENLNRLQELLIDIPMDYMILAEEIIKESMEALGKKINESIYITLVDHIYTAVFRNRDGIIVQNALLWDIKRFYPKEFEIGKKAVNKINEQFDTNLDDNEAAFIAIHFVNAEIGQDNVDDAYKATEIMQEITTIVKYHFGMEFDEESVYYYRFITHLKYLSQRMIKGIAHDNNDDDLYEVISNKYKNSNKCVEKIASFLNTKYKYNLSKEEKLYLTIYIERVIYKAKN